MTKVLILGHGYCAYSLASEATHRGWELRGNTCPCSKMSFTDLRLLIENREFDVVINAAVLIPGGRAANCDQHKDETILANVVFPKMVAEACDLAGVPLIHISTACLFDEQREYTEDDQPTRGWDGHCGTYVGSKLLSEKLVMEHKDNYVLRIRLPFDNISHPRNYLNKLMEFPTVYKHWNSLTHRGEFAKAALDLFEMDAEPGVYHVANQGQISVEQVCEKMLRKGIITKMPNFVEHPTTGCRLSTRKLSETGIMMRTVEEAVDDAIERWRRG